MTTKKSSTPAEIKRSFDELFNSFTKEELIDQEARLLAFHFLSEVEHALEQQGLNKKALAERIGTSASYITQLFRGDRLPNFTILARIQEALSLKFEVKAKETIADISKTKFEFPEVENPYGFVGVYKNLTPDYGKHTSPALRVDYNEQKIA